ncbi:MAG: carboxyl transferase domain-containing protein, partial [bacterium]|nr:carboxyl transferase domain-containing protein [bacterium]
MSLKKSTDKFLKKKEKAREMGGAKEIERQHGAGKLTVRERLELLFDSGTFEEMGVLAHHQSTHPDMVGRETPADGCVTGYGKIDGRLVACAAYDFTVMAGSIGYVQERKVDRLRELALRQKIPMVWLLDSAGARIQELAGSQFAESGKLFYDQVKMSGFIPQVAAMMGPCAAGTAYIPALADFVPMVKGTSSMALAGPPLVKAVIGEEISMEDLGGSKMHCEVSGVGDLEVADDKECIDVIREYLSY